MPGFYLPSENEFDPENDDFVLPFVTKERKYRHFDLPLRASEREQMIEFSKEEDLPHRFLPLLGFMDETMRYVRNRSGRRERKVKVRPIRFASHADAAYLQAYAEHLNAFYERALKQDGTSGSVLAYRRGGGTNIHHAKALFDEVRSRSDCTVFAMDISGFFDCLDHLLLRDEVAGLLGVPRLEGHDANVWKNVTRYSWVETVDLDRVLGRKRSRHGRVCSPSDFVDYVRGRTGGLVRTHDQPFGIPQGTPVSGLYANIYLRNFDREMISWCTKHGGSYRRYSDDIAVVLPLGAKVRHVEAIVEKMLADYGLAMSVDKTDTADFKMGLLASAKPIQYLGFTFDGQHTLIRPSSLDAYRRKMRRGIHAKLIAAKAKKVLPSEVYKRESLSRYTHLGKRRNFLRYAYKAADIMSSPEIRQQVKHHVSWFNRTWKKEAMKVFGDTIA
ncbi:MAG: group II intron reverse transcriptase domain-containing protein [Rhodobacter sp.]|nr:group II intron reverse transcriptase domain-containing protein [Rhodobacter sp.]MCA3492648.1 group II intron reverse transcriptase domain-containing protein [Rhodobacter sp.]MCA3499785.1 group II intron reverse transcriptase domain-containing protein [Rhodobacter sp.]MCA3502179.1 group II intron reverse transcriptase domain-containing protein [Rhodobacter sp.]MCA3518246.1 group II intron reverse transcriptase domain-containing protein [Rhodobacter sp.]